MQAFKSEDFNSDTEKMSKVLNSILTETAEVCLKRKIMKHSGSRNKKKPKWFDEPLNMLKKQLIEKEKLFIKYCTNPQVIGALFSHLKLYRKTRKRKHREYRQNIIFKGK